MKIGVVGATGVVGKMMLTVLQERKFPVNELTLMASARSAGKTIEFCGKNHTVREVSYDLIRKPYDFLLFSAGGRVSEQFAPIAEEAGNTVIDNSSSFRHNRPLIVPEINCDLLKGYKGIVANPNCSTIQLTLALYPLHLRFHLEKVIVSTYQSVSGAGQSGISALYEERAGKSEDFFFSNSIDLNVIPQIGPCQEFGYCQEEIKMCYETAKILSLNDLLISATTVRVPVLYGHSESVFASFRSTIDITEAVREIKNSPYLCYHPTFITPKELVDSEQSHICRLRMGFDDKSIQFWNVAHNIRLGAATNAINILSKMIELN